MRLPWDVLLRDVLLSRENYTFALDSQKGSTSTIIGAFLCLRVPKPIYTPLFVQDEAIYLSYGVGATYGVGSPNYAFDRLYSSHRRSRRTWCPSDGTQYGRQDPSSTP